jgi:hypothetical protein
MIGIGLMAFIVAWAVFLLSSQNITKRGIQQFNEIAFGPQLNFEISNIDEHDAHHGEATNVFFGSHADNPIILTGLPAYQGAVFSMPIDARPTSGYLQIDITSQVLNGVKGVLRVSIENTKRGEMLLYPGEAGRSLRIPLHAEELVKERLVVSYSLLGSHSSQTCSSQDGIAAIVEVETTSGLYLNLDRAIETPRDQVLALGRKIPIQWNENKQLKNQVAQIQLASRFIQQGERVQFSAKDDVNAFSEPNLRLLETSLPKVLEPEISFPHYVAAKGSNYGSRKFYETTSWRIKYEPREFKHQSLPDVLDLHLTMSSLLDDALWQVNVTLNGATILNQRLERNARMYRAAINLPIELQAAKNLIEVSIHSSHVNIGECNEGPVMFAQMERDTVLDAGKSTFDDPLSELQNAFRKMSKITVSGIQTTTHNQALFLSQMISYLAANDATLVGTRAGGNIAFLDRSNLQIGEDLKEDGLQNWVLSFDDDGEIQVEKIDFSKVGLNRLGAPNALLIRIPSKKEAL